MGSKSKKTTKKHVHENFQNMVAMAALNTHRDYINKQIINAAKIISEDLANQLKPYDLLFDVYKDVLVENNTTLRDLIDQLSDKGLMEKDLLGNDPIRLALTVPQIPVETKESLQARLFNKEDMLLDMEEVKEPAEKGFKVRLALTDVAKKDSRQLLVINKLASDRPELNKEVEAAMIGMVAGEHKIVHVDLPDGEDKTKGFDFDVEIVRISKPKSKVEVKVEEPKAPIVDDRPKDDNGLNLDGN